MGAGKTTLLRHILNAEHGYKIAVIENEFGEVPIDDALIGDRASRITTLSNGCICCSKSNELADALLDLLDGVDSGRLAFDRLIIECTGMADPGPITQTFSRTRSCASASCWTASSPGGRGARRPAAEPVQHRSGAGGLRRPPPADQNRRGAGLRGADPAAAADERPRAGLPVTHGDIDLSVLFDIEGFTLNDKLNLTPPAPLFRRIPQPQSDIRSIVVTLERPLPLMQISDVMEGLLLEYADNLLRYKGILSIEDEPRRLLFQGVQRLYNADWDREWLPEEERKSTLVFIGVDLPRRRFGEGLGAGVSGVWIWEPVGGLLYGLMVLMGWREWH